jgi:hypothetical protein
MLTCNKERRNFKDKTPLYYYGSELEEALLLK